MANWAVVIGVDKYWTEKASLKGAVGDALKMRRWLLDTGGGNVPETNLYLFLEPSPTTPPLPAGLKYLAPTKPNIANVIIKDLMVKSQGQGERFYFHFSGHGLADRIEFGNQDAIVTSDFDEVSTDNSYGLPSVLDYFKAAQFRDQFFFIDACRNIPWNAEDDEEFRIGQWPRPKRGDPNKPAVQQFVFYATSPGVRAKEIGEAGDERGAFTEELLAGLSGKGRAKAWDVARQQYVVNVDRLFQYVLDAVRKKRLIVEKNNETAFRLFQVPRLGGERGAVGGASPVLAQFEPDSAIIKKASLEVKVTPFKSASQVEVVIERDGMEVQKKSNIPNVPVSFTGLQPREYSVRARALDFEPQEKRWPCELYDDTQELEVFLVPTQGATRGLPFATLVDATGGETRGLVLGDAGDDESAGEGTAGLGDGNMRGLIMGSGGTRGASSGGASSGGSSRSMTGSPVPARGGGGRGAGGQGVRDSSSMGGGVGLAREGGSRAASGSSLARLLVKSSDPLAALEVADNTGVIKKSGEGSLDCRRLSPGFYRARLLAPEGSPVERLIELSPGETEHVHLDAPQQSGLLQDVARVANFNTNDDRTLEVSENVGPIASAQLSTVLALAGSVTNRNEQGWGIRLRNLGLQSFRESAPRGATTGLQILAGVEYTAPEVDPEGDDPQDTLAYLSQVRVRLWPYGQPVPQKSERPLTLSKIPGLAEFVAPTKPGPHWLSISLPGQPPVVFSLNMLREHLSMMVIHRQLDGQARIFQYLPPIRSYDETANPKVLRRLELMQRFYASNRLENAYQNAVDLLHGKWTEPLAGCLGSYILMKLNRAGELEVAARNMTNYYGALSDSHLIMAEYATAIKDDKLAKLFYTNALAQGLPIFADGLARLYDGVQHYEIKHPRTALLEQVFNQRVRGMLWTAWIPQGRLTPGETIEPAAERRAMKPLATKKTTNKKTATKKATTKKIATKKKLATKRRPATKKKAAVRKASAKKQAVVKKAAAKKIPATKKRPARRR